MAKSKVKFTYEDYQTLPESETKRYELLGGRLIMVPSPPFSHQMVSGNLEDALRDFVRENDLGVVLYVPMDVVFGEGEEREIAQPDIFFISEERKKIIAEKEIGGAPDLIVEITSPSTEERDRGYKKTLYARQGVKEYWLADPEGETIEVLTLGEEGFEQSGLYEKKEILKSPLLSGLSVELQEVFPS